MGLRCTAQRLWRVPPPAAQHGRALASNRRGHQGRRLHEQRQLSSTCEAWRGLPSEPQQNDLRQQSVASDALHTACEHSCALCTRATVVLVVTSCAQHAVPKRGRQSEMTWVLACSHHYLGLLLKASVSAGPHLGNVEQCIHQDQGRPWKPSQSAHDATRNACKRSLCCEQGSAWGDQAKVLEVAPDRRMKQPAMPLGTAFSVSEAMPQQANFHAGLQIGLHLS